MSRGRLAAGAVLLVVALGLGLVWREYLGWRAGGVVNALKRAPLHRIGVCRCAPDSILVILRDELRLEAALYGVGAAPRRPILLLHGLTPHGNDLPLYRVLGRRLADAGFVVAALDFAGYGDSDDPYAAGNEQALDARRDVDAALAAIANLPQASGKVMIVGHSMGAIEALDEGLSDARVGAVAAIGPPRRTAEVLATAEGRDYHWDRIRRTYDSVYNRALPGWFTRERFLALKAQRDLERYRAGWARGGHVPLLLIDGERESLADREYLRRYAAALTDPVRYVTIEDADHYLNSGRAGGLLFYDREAVKSVVQEMIRLSRQIPPA